MTLRHLRIFLAVCGSGFNTTRAAEALHMTQPAVSLAIRELEQYYSVVLFDRIGRRLKITEAGRRLQEYAGHITALSDDMEKEMRSWGTAGVLHVGASITIGSQFLPSYVKAFRFRCPETRVHVTVGPSDLLEQDILANRLDFALIEGITHIPSLVSLEYMEDYLTVICPPDCGFRQGQEISAEQFLQQSFLLRERGSGTRELFESVLEQAGFSVEPIWEAMSTTALVNAVINGLGISVLPYRMILEPLRRGLVITVRVKGLSFRRKYYIIHHREKFLTPPAKAFIDLCRNYEADYPLPGWPGLY